MRKEARHRYEPLIIPVGKISAGIAVIMDVDQTGEDRRPLQIDTVPVCFARNDRGKAAVFHCKGTDEKSFFPGKYVCISIKHGLSLLKR